ncbi:MAG: MarR family winged helix-turn-helix transcriptional regulator [Gaiellaceae bacterium]
MSNQKRQPLPGSSRDERPNVGILLRVPYQEVVRRVADGVSEAGFDDLRPAHAIVFQHIDADGSRLTTLADRAQMTKQSMGYLVDYLEQHGYLERRADPSDRRAALISLTEQGWAVVRASLAVIAKLEEEWTRELGDTETNQLRDTLGKLGQVGGG